MISKEAEMFEKANIVDIGLQPNEFTPRRKSIGSNRDQHMSVHRSPNQNNNGMTVVPDDPISSSLEEGIVNLNIDEVDRADNNLVVDEAFQKSLDERANQFMLHQTNTSTTNSFPSVPKPKVKYEYSDTFTIIEELDQWFTDLERTKLQKYQKVYESKFNVNFFNLNFTEKEDIINQVLLSDNPLISALCLVSILSGNYGQEFDPLEITEQILESTSSVVKLDIIPWVIDRLVSNFEKCALESSNVEIPSQILFHCCTLLYLIVLVGLQTTDRDVVTIIKEQFDQRNLLIVLVKFIDQWKWCNRSSMRIRNVILLLTKAFKFQIGDLNKRDQAKLYLEKKLNIDRKNDDPNQLTASPIDFHTYRQELVTRYPSFTPPDSKVPKTFEDSTSLTQFISIPKNQPLRQMNASNQEPPRIHIATPSPSPSNSPNNADANKNLKGKRVVQSNFVYPLIYPTEDEKSVTVPKSIQEASELFVSRVRDKAHLIQLWDEFDHFEKQERGWVDSLNEDKEKFIYNIKDDPSFTEEIKSLNRVESFYHEALPYLSSLTNVLLEVLSISHLDNIVFKQKEAPTHFLEAFNIVKTKTAVSKDSSYLLILMLKWFKVSHVLKFEHLSCLLYDSDYYSYLFQFLKSFEADELLARIQNTTLLTSPKYEKLDDYFCFTLHNMLTIASKITVQKIQRVLDLSEKDFTSILKQIFEFRNDALWRPTLKLVKEIAPLRRKQWRAKNMDLISLVYLHGETSLRDNWLSGRDVDAEVNDRYGQEIALRALIQFYNIRNFNDSMEKMGYKKNDYNYFTREAEFQPNEI